VRNASHTVSVASAADTAHADSAIAINHILGAMLDSFRYTAVVLIAAGCLGGCAALALPVAGTGISLVTGAGTLVKAGTEFTSSGVASRAFPLTLDDTRNVVIETLERLAVPLRASEETKRGWRIDAQASRRDIDIQLERLTPRLTRMRLVVKQGWFVRDRTTASEIIAQMERIITEREGPEILAAPPGAPGLRVCPCPP
jgi:hypothetical protein